MLLWLDKSQLVYCDTDSVIFIYDENNPKHKYPSNDAKYLPHNIRFGDALGEWGNEFGGWDVACWYGGCWRRGRRCIVLRGFEWAAIWCAGFEAYEPIVFARGSGISARCPRIVRCLLGCVRFCVR